MSLAELGEMSDDDLWKRMDAILCISRHERNPYYAADYSLDLYVKRIIDTALYQSFPLELKRKLIWMGFDFIVQMEYLSVANGFSNAVLDSKYFKQNGFLSPTVQLSLSAANQTTIVGSRIAFERLMHFIYFGFTKTELSTSDTFSKFKRWIFSLDTLSNLIYLIPFLPIIRNYDKKFRTAEVHSGSMLKKEVVQLKDNGTDLTNSILDLQNLLTNLFPRVLELFNHQRPSSIFGKPDEDFSWINYYLKKDKSELERLIMRVDDLIENSTHFKGKNPDQKQNVK